MIVGPAVRQSAIQSHYDALTPFYRLSGGPRFDASRAARRPEAEVTR